MKNCKDLTVMVVGAGTMGLSMAQVMAAHGIKTYMTSRHEATLQSAREKINTAINGLIREGLADERYREQVDQHLFPVTNDKFPEIGQEVDVVLETVVENADSKRAIYQQLNDCCRPDCIMASNTSGMDIFTVTEDVLSHPERLIIAHWFNPPHLMKLIEVVRGEKTSDETTECIRTLLEYVGKKPAVLNKFVPGFIVNRIATVINRELYYMIEQGWINGEDAENAIRYTDGLRYGFEGPLGIWDFVGLEIPMTVAKDVLPTLCNSADRMPLGDKLIAEGKTGVKAGEGVLKYGPMDEYVEKRNRRIIQMTKIMDQWDREDQ